MRISRGKTEHRTGVAVKRREKERGGERGKVKCTNKMWDRGGVAIRCLQPQGRGAALGS